MSKGFRKDKSVAEFSITTATDNCAVNLDSGSVTLPSNDATLLFSELKDVYLKLSHVLGDTTAMLDFERCLDYYHKTFLK